MGGFIGFLGFFGGLGLFFFPGEQFQLSSLLPFEKQQLNQGAIDFLANRQLKVPPAPNLIPPNPLLT